MMRTTDAVNLMTSVSTYTPHLHTATTSDFFMYTKKYIASPTRRAFLTRKLFTKV